MFEVLSFGPDIGPKSFLPLVHCTYLLTVDDMLFELIPDLRCFRCIKSLLLQKPRSEFQANIKTSTVVTFTELEEN